MTLTEFLNARIEEDEGAASECARATEREPVSLRATDGQVTPSALSAMEHIVRWDAGRVLAECEAKRRIVEVHLSGEAWCDHCSGGEHRGNPDACPTLRLLALPYVDHPDYDETWRP